MILNYPTGSHIINMTYVENRGGTSCIINVSSDPDLKFIFLPHVPVIRIWFMVAYCEVRGCHISSTYNDVKCHNIFAQTRYHGKCGRRERNITQLLGQNYMSSGSLVLRLVIYIPQSVRDSPLSPPSVILHLHIEMKLRQFLKLAKKNIP